MTSFVYWRVYARSWENKQAHLAIFENLDFWRYFAIRLYIRHFIHIKIILILSTRKFARNSNLPGVTLCLTRGCNIYSVKKFRWSIIIKRAVRVLLSQLPCEISNNLECRRAVWCCDLVKGRERAPLKNIAYLAPLLMAIEATSSIDLYLRS